MNKSAQKHYNRLKKSFPGEKMEHAAFDEMVRTYANICSEEETLQEFVDKHGTAYEVENRAGEKLWKLYPQHNMLSKLRTQKNTMFGRLIKYVRDEEIQDDGEDLLR